MKFLLSLFFLIHFTCLSQDHYIDTVLMGSRFTLTVVTPSDSLAKVALNDGLQEIIRIEKLISSWDPKSQTSTINRNAGFAPVKVSYELYALIARSQKISGLSNGYFDISFASIDKVWDFKSEYTQTPNQTDIDRSVALIDYRNIQLNPQDTSVYLTQKGMKIGFGAIGKGYAAEQAKNVMKQRGIPSGVVNAGGDLISWGRKPNGSFWNVGIQDPEDKNNIFMWIPSNDQAIVTSGNYERYVMIDGKRYCHIINPKTGWPVRNLQSVTIICANAEVADALATTVFVLGVQDGLTLINKLNGVECVIIDDENQVHFSDQIQSNLISHEN